MKKKKKLLTLLLSLVLAMTMMMPVSAASSAYERVFDDAGILTADEIASLNEEINQQIDAYDFDIVLLTVPSLDGKDIAAYADDYYDENGFGLDEDNSGVLFLIDMEEHNYYISTCGEGITAFTDYGISRAGEKVSSYLSDGDYAGGLEEFLRISNDYFTAYYDDTVYDSDNPYEESKNYVVRELIALAIALVVGVGITLMMKSQMNNAKPQEYAGNYLKKDSLHLTNQRDMFLYSQITKVKKEEKEDSGSSTHSSSSGTTHGGGGGSF
ncbi:MAG: TPM domain-containing protein [Hespellia sp.]|nr:TPM domain-containing protein [Hespellia sp.]